MKKLLILAILFIGVAFTANAQADTTLQQFVGKYKFPDGSVVPEVTVTLENGELMMASSAGTSTLVKQAEDVYIITAFQGTAAFKRNDAKKVIGVSINAMGYVLEGNKEDGIYYWRPAFQKR